MKKSIKAGLGLSVLGLLANPQEGLTANQAETNKNVREVLGENKDTKINESTTYVPKTADFQKQSEKQSIIDSVKITQSLAMINTHSDKLIEFYGKEKLSKKVRQVMKEHPDFGELSYRDQKPIIEATFSDFFSEHAGNDEGIMWVALAFLVFYMGLNYINNKWIK